VVRLQVNAIIAESSLAWYQCMHTFKPFSEEKSSSSNSSRGHLISCGVNTQNLSDQKHDWESKESSAHAISIYFDLCSTFKPTPLHSSPAHLVEFDCSSLWKAIGLVTIGTVQPLWLGWNVL